MNRDLFVRYLPLAAHVVSTAAVGYCVLIPRSCIAGWNELTLGFGASLLGSCVVYVLGQRLRAARQPEGGHGAPS